MEDAQPEQRQAGPEEAVQQHAAPADAVDQAGGDDAADDEQQGDRHRTVGGPVALQVQRQQHLGREGVDGEHGDHRAGPEQGDEEHALAVAGVEQVPDGDLPFQRLFGQVFQREGFAVDLADDPFCVRVAALAQQPARRLGGADA